MHLRLKMSGVGHRMIPDLAGPSAIERSWMAVIRKSRSGWPKTGLQPRTHPKTARGICVRNPRWSCDKVRNASDDTLVNHLFEVVNVVCPAQVPIFHPKLRPSPVPVSFLDAHARETVRFRKASKHTLSNLHTAPRPMEHASARSGDNRPSFRPRFRVDTLAEA